EFMKLRAHRSAPIDHEAYASGSLSAPEVTASNAARALSATDRFSPLTFALGLRVPACTYIAAEKVRGAQPHWFYSRSDHSWACALVEDGEPTVRVWQRGSRRLWDEVEGAYAWWVERGRPGWERFGVMVRGEGEWGGGAGLGG
ncbi:protein-L-isoaspartate(D-aspartate) O-methyltransferase, partial [Streptomyces sp. DT225]